MGLVGVAKPDFYLLTCWKKDQVKPFLATGGRGRGDYWFHVTAHCFLACYHSVQTLLSSCLFSKKLKIKIYKTIILLVVLYGYETWSLPLMKEQRLRAYDNGC
jgi:hypothetical protein